MAVDCDDYIDITLARIHTYLTPACAICLTDTRALHARDVDADILTDTILQRHTDIRYRDIQTYAIVAYPVTVSPGGDDDMGFVETSCSVCRQAVYILAD